MLPYILLLCGFGLLIKAADWLVDGASALARRLKVSDLAIGLTVVAFGTSTPELFVNLMAAAQGKTALALGNVIGSNIFNIFFILGITATIRPIPCESGSNAEVLVLIVASLLPFLCMFTGRRRSIDRWEGGVVVLLYIACRRRDFKWILPEVRKIDPQAFYIIEHARDMSKILRPIYSPTGGWTNKLQGK